MMEDKVLEIIKGAILLEHRGKSFYELAAQNAENEMVRQVFETMAAEEGKHIEILNDQYAHLKREGKLKPMPREGKPLDVISSVITQKIKQEVSAAGYEAAAISAAMAMEEKAVQFYAESAGSTDDPLAQELYQWLANWEKTHLTFLSQLDRELTESIWYDNKFWPIF